MNTPLTQSRAADDARASAPVRLGAISYLNVAPVYDWLTRCAPDDLPGVTLVDGVPAQMNRALEAGVVDISNVSSFAFGQHAREWALAPGLSVAAHGRVDSVLLFSWHADWHDLDGRSIALTDHSATSVELTRLLAERRSGARPRYVTTAPDLDAMLTEHDAALLIGDIALREGYLRRDIAGRGRPFVFDLAREWQEWTGLPFVFAVWAVRADRAEAVRAAGVVELLRDSTARGLADLPRLAREASARLDLPASLCADYLRLLDYALSERDLRGLRRFLELSIPDFRWEDVRQVGETRE
ncbi:MAG TPA: menaquinone biosynthesis protein [Ktedonobacterales bacterium]|jgi:chorismate dehydratase|nr:menaquinone biosynthesis protein [Ktedonobacterales bacterium]